MWSVYLSLHRLLFSWYSFWKKSLIGLLPAPCTVEKPSSKSRWNFGVIWEICMLKIKWTFLKWVRWNSDLCLLTLCLSFLQENLHMAIAYPGQTWEYLNLKIRQMRGTFKWKFIQWCLLSIFHRKRPKLYSNCFWSLGHSVHLHGALHYNTNEALSDTICPMTTVSQKDNPWFFCWEWDLKFCWSMYPISHLDVFDLDVVMTDEGFKFNLGFDCFHRRFSGAKSHINEVKNGKSRNNSMNILL